LRTSASSKAIGAVREVGMVVMVEVQA